MLSFLCSYNVFTYRDGEWSERSTQDLLPGDIVSLQPRANAGKSKKEAKGGDAGNDTTVANDVVPCDCLLLRGSAVLNEATLTGESVPQMKDELPMPSGKHQGRALDVNGQDRVHVLFSSISRGLEY